jgi:GDP-4-dehydro-6-deoxy-D-mannose reductase
MSWKAPADTIETNVIGTIHLFEAIRKAQINSKILVAGSSEEYGMVYPEELPIKETNPLRPLSPYGVSKVAQDKLGYQYCRSYGLEVVITRAFNHTGPRRGDVFATSNFAKQIAEAEKGVSRVIHVGNLNAQRDFSDVRDIVKAYWVALEKCKPGEAYNICSEKARSIQEVLNLLLSMTAKDVEIRQDPSRLRPADVEVLHGDCSKFKQQTGWEPAIPFEKTLEDLLN